MLSPGADERVRRKKAPRREGRRGASSSARGLGGQIKRAEQREHASRSIVPALTPPLFEKLAVIHEAAARDAHMIVVRGLGKSPELAGPFSPCVRCAVLMPQRGLRDGFIDKAGSAKS